MDNLNENTNTKGNILFVKEVARYFMDFLETDFHKRKTPKRSVKLKDSGNILTGINLNKYPAFTRDAFSLISSSFNKNELNTIQKGVYKSNLPKNLLELITMQADKISNKEILGIAEEIAIEIEHCATLYRDDIEKAILISEEKADTAIRRELVTPLLDGIKKSIVGLDIGDDDDFFIMEEELAAILMRLVDEKIASILKKLLSGSVVRTQLQIKNCLDLKTVRSAILTFFENTEVGDLFSEIFSLERNKAILEKQDLYFYFGEIAFNKAKYPIFYMPVTLNRVDDVFHIEFDSQIFVNKKALEYILQEYNELRGTRGGLQGVGERIIYIAQHQNTIPELLNAIMGEISNVFSLDKRVSVSDPHLPQAKSQDVRVTNAQYFALFDKSDEAIINDYEEILSELNQEGGALSVDFSKLIDDFIHRNPTPINPEVEREWDEKSVPEKLVFNSPVPLNSEQLQILSALHRDHCNYLVVEGPPGTGKSHTITAIIFDAILRRQSVLVLSDKKEALDVVEDKITETMDKVRFDEEEFQNPILRLGKTGSTYAKILSKSTLEKIKVHHRATRKGYDKLVEDIDRQQEVLREDIEAEVLAYDDIELEKIRDFYALEEFYSNNNYPFDLDELSASTEAVPHLDGVRSFVAEIQDQYKQIGIAACLGVDLVYIEKPNELAQTLSSLVSLCLVLSKIADLHKADSESISRMGRFRDSDVDTLSDYIKEYVGMRHPLFGYLFSSSKLQQLDHGFRSVVPFSTHLHIRDAVSDVQNVISYSSQIKSALEDNGFTPRKGEYFLEGLMVLMSKPEFLAKDVECIGGLIQQIEWFLEGYSNCERTLSRLGISDVDARTWTKSPLGSMSGFEFDRAIKYAEIKRMVSHGFKSIPQANYLSQKRNIEALVTTQVTHLLDERLIDFSENYRNDAETIKNIIKSKTQFPKEEFKKLRDAFPCILAGIRDFAEYIPLEAGIFDLVIIDEASQVSIAQAFPALIRAKKVLILGDKKQFSNVKATQARSETNREYTNALTQVFRSEVSSDEAKLTKIAKFDIKTSILEFFEFISNYNIQLLKHFRGYKELISYSNKYFYHNSLQVMKIRGKAIDDVIRFTQVESSGKTELVQNTNYDEINAIINELRRLRDEGAQQSIGIITPHTNQQKLLAEEIDRLPDRDHYYEKLGLKIMTFDTCQGEERDIIMYSMVASADSDKLWGIFIKDFASVDVEEDGKIKAQRLNVGFSRAKECVHFFISKPLNDFDGSIGEALRYFHNLIEEAKRERSTDEVDKKSKMEPEVMNWFYQTDFWNNNKDDIEFIPQFEIGKYLKQLDITYKHPAYKVDFLLVYRGLGREQKVIIEYDGFKEHFTKLSEVNAGNYQRYYSEDDIYREKVLESYGYKFLRINKFNIGANPITTLNERIGKLLNGGEDGRSSFLDSLQETVEGLNSGDKKECPKCKEIRDFDDFKDNKCARGYGRFCKYCKTKSQDTTLKEAPVFASSNIKCPRCAAKMILRKGPRGEFYGCSRFPYCKGTQES